jgi:sulfite reductase alpha subunit-like flavoprotein
VLKVRPLPNYLAACVNHHVDNVLYFGCRSAAKDEHYGDQWRVLSESQKLVYRKACSRDVPEGTPRVYVQDLMKQEEDMKRIWEYINRGAWIYVSGCVNVRTLELSH